MPTLDEQITVAEKHVQDGRRIVANQRERIARGTCYNEAEARELLEMFEQAQALFESALETALGAAKFNLRNIRRKRPQRLWKLGPVAGRSQCR